MNEFASELLAVAERPTLQDIGPDADGAMDDCDWCGESFFRFWGEPATCQECEITPDDYADGDADAWMDAVLNGDFGRWDS